jgi:CubicO group peptidase (beta-lactamase class C family)
LDTKEDGSSLNADSTVSMGSAGKFITHIAALQLVQRGAIGLDDPVYKHIPELESLPLITRTVDDQGFTLSIPDKKITLRHLLLHTSGLSDSEVPLIKDYLASTIEKPVSKDDAPYIVKNFSIPLIFEPGEGFAYGNSIHWTQLLVTRLSGNYLQHVQDNIFNPLTMSLTTYLPQSIPEVWDRRLQMVERKGDVLVPADELSLGPMCSVLDVGKIFSDLMSSASKLLNQEFVELLFKGQLGESSHALEDLRDNHENYAFCTDLLDDTGPPAVNWSFAGLVAEEQLPGSELPAGTVTWEGMPNVLWALNKPRGLGMFFATQLIPVGDKNANELAVTFMKDGWGKFA